MKINVGRYLISYYMALFLNILSIKGLFIAQRPTGDKWGEESGLWPEALTCLRKLLPDEWFQKAKAADVVCSGFRMK